MQAYYRIIVALLLVSSGIDGSSQTITQTVTRSYMQNINCSAATTFAINAEKASIVVTGWNNNYIEVRLNFFATHPDKKIAERELNFMRYAIVQEKDLIELRNIFVLPAAIDHIQSKLEIKMEIFVPAKNKLQITNKYGEISLIQLSGNIQVNISFGDLHFTDIAGQVTLGANYSDIRGSHLHTTFLNCTDEKSKLSLDLDGGGSYSFNSKHGDLDLSLKNINTLTIKSNRSDITIRPQNMDACRYKITCTDGTLYLPEKYTNRLIKKANQTSFITSGSVAMPLLAINALFNSVTIK